jgi:hypothetical protein
MKARSAGDTTRFISSPMGLSWDIFLQKLSLTVLLINLSSCVEITSYPISDKNTYENLPGAIPYTLPMSSFLVTATYTLSCTNDGTNWVTQITPTFSIAQVNTPDPHERYYVNSEDLKSVFKDSQVTIATNANQTLSSINGTVNDLVGPTLATAVGVAAGIGAAVATAGIVPAAVALDYRVPRTPLLAAAPATHCGANLQTDTGNAIDQIKKLRIKITDRLADPSKPSTTTDPQLGIYLNQIAAITTKSLTIKTSYLWTPYPAKSDTSNAQPAENIVRTSFDDTALLVNRWFDGVDANTQVQTHATLPIPNEIELWFVPWSYVPTGAAPAQSPIKGFVIRYPAIATLRMCGNKCNDPITPDQKNPAPPVALDNTTTVVEFDNINIPQFGRRIVFPFRNEVLQNTVVALSLGPDGSVTSLGTHDTGNANTVLATLGTGAQSVSSAFAARSAAISSSNTAAAAVGTYADTILKAQSDCITQRNNIIAAGGIPLVQCSSP